VAARFLKYFLLVLFRFSSHFVFCISLDHLVSVLFDFVVFGSSSFQHHAKRLDTIRYDTIRDASLTCARKPT